MDLAASFTVSGVHGFIQVLALICFFAAAVVAWFAPGHKASVILISAGLFFFVLAGMVSG